MMRFVSRGLFALQLVLILSPVAWGRSERHAYRELERTRQQWQRELEKIDALRQRRTYPYFKLDVF